MDQNIVLAEAKVSDFSIRILVADDFEGWRNFAISTLQRQADWQIVGVAADGAEALRKAEQLKPDLILMDIGIPVLNGIKVARRLRSICCSKIIFLTENQCSEIVQEALRTGALGYVLKSDAASDLMRAVERVLDGRVFLSQRLLQLDSVREEASEIRPHNRL